ncbi:MAG: hypothetical protein HKM88_01650 [Halobacteria archaeon]|nr:hypothetical protein [Halobacteria archaeon]
MQKILRILLALSMAAGLLPASAWAGGGSLLPVVPQAQDRFSETQGCVEPTEQMRRNHMEHILHQRDETMYRGIRTKQYSLEQCINCHVSDTPDAPRYSSEEHFCTAAIPMRPSGSTASSAMQTARSSQAILARSPGM